MLSIARRTRFAAAVAAAAVSSAGFAAAPPMQLTVNTGAFGKTVPLNPNSVSPGGVGTYSGVVLGTGGTWQLNYNLTASSGSSVATQAGTFSITNLSGAEAMYSIRLVLPTSAIPGDLTGLFNGALSGTLITQGAGYFRSVVGQTAMWAATTESSTVGQLFTAPMNVVRNSTGATSLGSQSFGGMQPSAPAPVFGTDVAINLNFTLSANATASFSSSLGGVGVPIPAPGAFALLGAAGLATTRRRRR
jgi:MYXO-CTERM domain-containing protein